jgi:PBP1b-binding outer membrane lipoprotein LpoB
MRWNWRHGLTAIGAVLAVSGCTSVDNAPGTPTVYSDPGTAGPVQGVGIESQDIVSMTDQMMRDMLTEPRLAGRARAPNVIVDDEYLENDSSWRVDKKLITERLRVNLNRAAKGRMIFVNRHAAEMVTSERQAKKDGRVDTGTLSMTSAPKGGDYRLSGHIGTEDSLNPRTGMKGRYTQITFEMTDLDTGEIVWSNMYEMEKSSQDDVIYR